MKPGPGPELTKGIKIKLSQNQLKFSINSCKSELTLAQLELAPFCEYRPRGFSKVTVSEFSP